MPINITPEFVQQLLDQVSKLIEHNSALSEEVAMLNAKVGQLTRIIEKLTEQKNKNSKNSSKPPSSDGYKKPAPKSLRGKSGKKKGGQEGHDGTNLSQSAIPDNIVGCMPSKCEFCAHREECMEKAQILERRQVIDAVVKTEVTEYDKLRVVNCPLHGWTREGSFPEGVSAPVQYGENLQALAVALNTVGAVSISRTHEILANVFNVPLSTGTISSMVSRCADRLGDVLSRIGCALTSSNVDHADETGIRVDGKLHWVHVLSNGEYTLLSLHSKRGWEAMEAIGYIPLFHGVLVHDCWSPYWKHPDLTHAICCAHLLRELTGIEENHPAYTWPKLFKELLLNMKSVRDKASCKGQTTLSYYYQKKFSAKYDAIIETAYAETPEPQPDPTKKKGRKKRGKVLALVDRLKTHKASVCLFIKDFNVPFDNNLAERDLRVIKTKAKVSGCFRSIEGAQDYLKIMSFVGTAKKLGHNAYEAIQNAISGTAEFIFVEGAE